MNNVLPIPAIQDVDTLLTPAGLAEVDITSFNIASHIEYTDRNTPDGEFVLRRMGQTVLLANGHKTANDMAFEITWCCSRRPGNTWSMERQLMQSTPPHDPQDASALMQILDQTVPFGGLYCPPFVEDLE